MTSVDGLRVELSISDPWEAASCAPLPLPGRVVQFTEDWAAVALNEPALINGVRVRGAVATPRHVGDTFEPQSSHETPANIVLTAAEVPRWGGRDAVQDVVAASPSVTSIGGLSFIVR